MNLLVLITVIMTLGFASYNSRGLGPGKMDYIAQLCGSHDFVLVQEHWQLPSRLSIFTESIDGICSHAVSAIDDTELLMGRPFGGCAILWRSSLRLVITPIHCQSSRLCAVNVSDTSGQYLFTVFNAYMPVDTNADQNNLEEFNSVLHEISGLCGSSCYDNIIIGGDFNTDFSRRQSLHTVSLEHFLSEEELRCARDLENSTEFTYESTTGNRSNIDHFFVSSNLLSHQMECKTQHDADNFSDHGVLSLTMPLTVDNTHPATSVPQVRLKWDEADATSLDDYQSKLSRSLSRIQPPLEAIHCTDAFCRQHADAIVKYHDEIVQSCIKTSMSSIPKSRSKPRVAGWNTHVRQFRETALFWNFLWKENGKPKLGLIAQTRRRTRAEYHRAVKRVKAQANSIASAKMADALVQNHSRDFWREVKKTNKSAKPVPSTMDGVTGEREISEVFARKYERLYNGVSYDPDDMNNLRNDLDSKIRTECCIGYCYHHHHVTAELMDRAFSRLNAGKRDGDGCFSTDHLIHGGRCLRTHLCLLFTAMLRHGHTPPRMLDSTIIPIPKSSRKSLSDSGNYRGIALNSPLSKTFELVILDVHQDALQTTNLQFGFKKKSSTTQCTFVVQETIQYYLNNGTPVHTMLLDASQAFDGLHYVKLFRRLMSQGLCPLVCRILLAMHTDQLVRLRWGGVVSDSISVSNGVKQGGILSPVLFSIYADAILNALRESGQGCYIGRLFCGAVAYADDIIILAPTRSALINMLIIAEKSASDLKLKFNASKCQYLIFKPTHSVGEGDRPIPFCGQQVPVSNSATHLGHYIGMDQNAQSVNKCVEELVQRTNALKSKFAHCTYDVRYSLFRTYCMCAYGAVLWDFDHNTVERFFCAWRKCVRRVLGVPYTTHSGLLTEICGDLPPQIQLHRRFLNFLNSCANSANDIVKLCASLAISGSQSPTGNSLSHLCDVYGLERLRLPSRIDYPQATPGPRATAIRDFLKLHEDTNDSEVREIINYLCTY